MVTDLIISVTLMIICSDWLMSVMLISVSHDTIVSNKHEEQTRHYYVNFQHKEGWRRQWAHVNEHTCTHRLIICVHMHTHTHEWGRGGEQHNALLSLSPGTHQKEEESALSHCHSIREREGVCTLWSCYCSISIIRKRGRETETEGGWEVIIVGQACCYRVIAASALSGRGGEREREVGQEVVITGWAPVRGEGALSHCHNIRERKGECMSSGRVRGWEWEREHAAIALLQCWYWHCCGVGVGIGIREWE